MLIADLACGIDSPLIADMAVQGQPNNLTGQAGRAFWSNHAALEKEYEKRVP